jgi:hypothetical protein
MRTIALLILVSFLAAAPASAAPDLEPHETPQAGEPVGEQWHERWQGRRHLLYDENANDTATDGLSANARADCRSVPVRMKRADGAFTIRRITRCD